MYVKNKVFHDPLLLNKIKLYYAVYSKNLHKDAVISREDEVNEFSAYWIMLSRVRFIISKLPYVKKITSISFLIITRPVRFLFYYIIFYIYLG